MMVKLDYLKYGKVLFNSLYLLPLIFLYFFLLLLRCALLNVSYGFNCAPYSQLLLLYFCIALGMLGLVTKWATH